MIVPTLSIPSELKEAFKRKTTIAEDKMADRVQRKRDQPETSRLQVRVRCDVGKDHCITFSFDGFGLLNLWSKCQASPKVLAAERLGANTCRQVLQMTIKELRAVSDWRGSPVVGLHYGGSTAVMAFLKEAKLKDLRDIRTAIQLERTKENTLTWPMPEAYAHWCNKWVAPYLRNSLPPMHAHQQFLSDGHCSFKAIDQQPDGAVLFYMFTDRWPCLSWRQDRSWQPIANAHETSPWKSARSCPICPSGTDTTPAHLRTRIHKNNVEEFIKRIRILLRNPIAKRKAWLEHIENNPQITRD